MFGYDSLLGERFYDSVAERSLHYWDVHDGMYTIEYRGGIARFWCGYRGDSPWEEVATDIVVQMQQGNIPGMAVAVTKPGEILWTGAFGWANLENNRAVTVDTPFMLASVSKTVTAAAVMKAEEQGRLSLGDEVNVRLPFKVDNPKLDDERIEVRHLVSHTSGIKDNWGQMPYADGDSPHALGAYLEGYLVAGGTWYDADKNFYAYAPGTGVNYGNIATALAGYLVEVHTDAPFDAFCEDTLFDVLDMDQTGWHLQDFDPATVAMPYGLRQGEFEALGHYGYPDYPDGQLRSSVSDMATFLAAVSHDGSFQNKRVLAPETVTRMFQPPVPEMSTSQFVFWYEDRWAGRDVVGHNGGTKALRRKWCLLPIQASGSSY